MITHILRLAYTILLIILLFLAQNLVYAQDGRQTDVFLSKCPETSSKSAKDCHYDRGLFLIYYIVPKDTEYVWVEHKILRIGPDYFQADEAKLAALNDIQRATFGIRELEIAVSGSKGDRFLNLELANAKIKLSQLYLEKNLFDNAEELKRDAGDIFALLAREVDGKQNIKWTEEAVIGLIRAGRPLDALRATEIQSLNGASKAYLRAEAMFSLGNRSGAADAYEDWIKAGCDSGILMITNDGRREKWTLYRHTTPPNLTLCEQLPDELRSRLENLSQQFKHPNNLPKRNVPSLLYLSL